MQWEVLWHYFFWHRLRHWTFTESLFFMSHTHVQHTHPEQVPLFEWIHVWGVGIVPYQSEGHLLMWNRPAERETGLLHTGSKKARPWFSSSTSLPGQRTDGVTRKQWSSSGLLPCHSATDALFIYWKNKSQPALATPLISCSLTALTTLFQSHQLGPGNGNSVQ